MENISKDTIEDIAKKCEGFSGRELTKMVVAWHDAAFTLPDPVLSPDLMYKILKKFQLQHQLKHTWTQSEQQIFGKLIGEQDEEFMTGSKQDNSHIKDDDMVRRQEEIMDQINKGRLDLKAGREQQELDIKEQAQQAINQNKQK